MPEFILSTIIIFAATLISASILGLIAGFNPSLYLTQVAITSHSKRPRGYTIALMAGVLFALLVLVVLFQTMQLETLLGIIDSTVRAVIVSVVFNLLVGVAIIVAGIWFLRRTPTPSSEKPEKSRKGKLISVFSLGFIRTTLSISGIVAAFIAGNIIANFSYTILERTIFTLSFFIAAVVPFVVVLLLMQRKPDQVKSVTEKITNFTERFNYRPVVSYGAIILGSAVVIYNLMLVLFY